MKCPKCNYLGFETGDRCRNCGYDFSLLVSADPEPDLPLTTSEPDARAPQPWLEDLDRALGGQRRTSVDSGAAFGGDAAAASAEAPAAEAMAEPIEEVPASASPAGFTASAVDSIAFDDDSRFHDVAAPSLEPALAGSTMADPGDDLPLRSVEPDDGMTAARPAGPMRIESRFPLFSTPSLDDDQPLIKVPPRPRRPLSVRRTPDAPRWRAVSKPPRGTVPAADTGAPEREPVLAFPEERQARAPVRAGRDSAAGAPASAPAARLLAALIDHAILLSIDLAVAYFTLRMASLSMADWRLLPAVPMLAFLSLLKLTYFFAFTAVGGQTIGKMATGIRVVTEDGGPVDPARAARRTLAGVLSALVLGLGFLMGLVGAERKALHDRLARTRVVVQGL
ncbi:MAG TPA: RDD family protein [Vicinamibacterales bacterium]|nr:RDD family protein [Vicinamibacterales bacterium]